jgi:DNA/RNA endonuclease YhcR with UshA esterase domain
MEIITINDGTASIEIIARENINLNEGQTIQVLGKISEYKGTIQIEAEKIKIL